MNISDQSLLWNSVLMKLGSEFYHKISIVVNFSVVNFKSGNCWWKTLRFNVRFSWSQFFIKIMPIYHNPVSNFSITTKYLFYTFYNKNLILTKIWQPKIFARKDPGLFLYVPICPDILDMSNIAKIGLNINIYKNFGALYFYV